MKRFVTWMILGLFIISSLAGCSTLTDNQTVATTLAKETTATATTETTAADPAGKPPVDAAKPGGSAGGGMGGGSIDTSGITTSYLDVPYANASETQKLDIYLPNEGDGLFPVIIVFHGGGFMMGSKTGGDISAMFESLDHGFAVVSVDYRLSGEAIFPAAIQDAKAAIRFIRANAAEYNLNPDKIALWGDSAGGNIASIAGTTGGTNDLYDTSLGYADVSDDVTAVVDWFGPINFLKMDEQFEASGVARATGTTNSESSPESKYIGQLITQASDLVAEANPESYITKDDPAFLIQHGTVDGNVPTQQSIDFAAALQSVLGSDKVQLTLLDGAGHGGTQFESAENLDLVFAFLDQSMK